MKHILSVLIIFLVVLGTANAQNYAYKSQWGLGFGGSYVRVTGAELVGAEGAIGGYLSLQRDFSEATGIRIKGFYRQVKSTNVFPKPETTVLGADVDLIYRFIPCEPVVPYLALGIGLANYDIKNAMNFADESGLDYSINFGIGMNIRLSHRWDIVSELSYHNTANDKIDGFKQGGPVPSGGILGGYSDSYMTFNVGFKYNFGLGEQSKVCDLYNGLKMEQKDMTDYDRIERMIKENQPKQVDPVDYKRIEDMIKKCCDQKKEEKIITLVGVNFDFNKHEVRNDATPILNNAVSVLKENPNVKVEIQGHTDNVGTDEYNQKLSEKRAQAVYDYLVKNGIAPSRLSTKGFGERNPLRPNDTAANRELNRRVEFVVVK